MPKDYKGEKQKPSVALVISVGPKMPKKPEDTSKPDMKKYGAPMAKAWDILKRGGMPIRFNKRKDAERTMMPEPEPEPEPMPEEPDPEMKRRAAEAKIAFINSIRRKRDKFDESQEVVPTSTEEQSGGLDDLDYSHFLKPPEER